MTWHLGAQALLRAISMLKPKPMTVPAFTQDARMNRLAILKQLPHVKICRCASMPSQDTIARENAFLMQTKMGYATRKKSMDAPIPMHATSTTLRLRTTVPVCMPSCHTIATATACLIRTEMAFVTHSKLKDARTLRHAIICRRPQTTTGRAGIAVPIRAWTKE